MPLLIKPHCSESGSSPYIRHSLAVFKSLFSSVPCSHHSLRTEPVAASLLAQRKIPSEQSLSLPSYWLRGRHLRTEPVPASLLAQRKTPLDLICRRHMVSWFEMLTLLRMRLRSSTVWSRFVSGENMRHKPAGWVWVYCSLTGSGERGV